MNKQINAYLVFSWIRFLVPYNYRRQLVQSRYKLRSLHLLFPSARSLKLSQLRMMRFLMKNKLHHSQPYAS